MTNFNNQTGEEGFLFDKGRKNPFGVPEGYFESLPAKVLNKIEAKEELKQYAALYAIAYPQSFLKERGHFVVPKEYFITNKNLLEYKYELSTYNELAKIPKPQLKALTEEYLKTFSTKILKQIEVADELHAFTTLSELKKENAFTLQPEYFETIADKVKERYYSNEHQKTSIVEQLLSFIFKPKIAIAYSFLLITVTGAFFYFNQPDASVVPGDCKTLACLERKELLNDHTMQNLDEDNLYDLVDLDELDKQLSGPAADSLSITTNPLPGE